MNMLIVTLIILVAVFAGGAATLAVMLRDERAQRRRDLADFAESQKKSGMELLAVESTKNATIAEARQAHEKVYERYTQLRDNVLLALASSDTPRITFDPRQARDRIRDHDVAVLLRTLDAKTGLVTLHAAERFHRYDETIEL